MLKKFLAIAVVMLMASAASATTISVKLAGTASNDLAAGESAGVVSVPNWNNVNGGSVAGSVVTGSVASLVNDAGTATGVGLTYSGGTATNNPRVTVNSVGTTSGDMKMMQYSLGTANDMAAQNVFDGGGANYHQELLTTNNGPKDVQLTLTNLNAQFPGGYDVYVYVTGTSPGWNQATGAGGYSINSVRNDANPMFVIAGPSGTNSLVSGMNQGGNGSAPQLNPLSIEVPANLPGAQLGLLWACNTIGTDKRTGEFLGYAQAALGAVDTMPLDFGPVSDNVTVSTNPGPGSDYPLNSAYAGASFQDPATRGIPVGNYVKFSSLSLDTLDIDGRNIAGMRAIGYGSSGLMEFGGISGIQIVGLQAEAAPVAEPAGLGLIGLALLSLRKRRS